MYNKLKQASRRLRRGLAYIFLRNPFDAAYIMCKGRGLEIGAMSAPYVFHHNCQVEYADIHTTAKLQQIVSSIPIPNLYAGRYVTPAHLLKPPQYGLEMLESELFDFVYSSNCLEHTPNPIWALLDQLRVVKKGGIVYCVIPNKVHTYDRERASTLSSTLIERYLTTNFDHSIEEALDVIFNTVGHPLYEQYKKNAAFYAETMINNREGIHHFFVFDELNTLELLQFVCSQSSASLEYFSSSQEPNIHFALRKH